MVLRSNFVERESSQFVVANATRERFGTLAKQRPRGTAEDDKPCRRSTTVYENTEHFEQPRQNLDFIDHNESFQSFKSKHGIIETS